MVLNQQCIITSVIMRENCNPCFSPIGSRPPSPKSDTELEHQKEATSQTALTGDELAVLDDVKWEWGELPQKSDESSAIATASMLEPKSECLVKDEL